MVDWYSAGLVGDYDIITSLIESNQDVNEKSTRGWTALQTASWFGYKHLIDILLEHKADINLQKEDGCTALYLLCQRGHLDLVKRFIQLGADIGIRRVCGATPLYIACQKNQLEIAKYLLENGADINASKADGATPLYIACQKGYLPLVKLLLQHEPNLAITHTTGATPFFVACETGKIQVAEFLLASGQFEIDQVRNNGSTALKAAAIYSHLETVRWLLDHKANIDHQDEEKKTVLHYAIKEKKFELVRELVLRGADQTILDCENKTPLDYVDCKTLKDIIENDEKIYEELGFSLV